MFDPEVRYSHPPDGEEEGVLLRDHLRDVASRVEYIVPSSATTPNGDPLQEVVRRLALVHDLGKATTWFQQYVDPGRRDPAPPEKRYHAPLGSFAAFYVLENAGYDAETCLAGFVAVAKHHGRLPDITGYVYDRTTGDQRGDSDRLTALKKQAVDINDNTPDVAETVFADVVGDRSAWREFARSLLDDSLLERVGGHVSAGEQELSDALSDSCYALVLQCWSALVFADKTSAAGASNTASTYSAEKPSRERLEAHVRSLEAGVAADPNGSRTERLNHYRSRAREAVLERSRAFAADGGGVATLTLPTGMGKTLTGLSAAFDLRERLGGERVVYALPFTSIIDQVVEEVEDVYGTDGMGRLLTAHHHLAETTIRDDEEDDESIGGDVGGMLAESWRAGLTVTTFVQFFESLAGPRNTQSMKLPALRNSIVVLDEPQSLPLDWWKLAPRLVELLVEQYDATVITMTATQPKLFEDATELVDDPDAYFDAVERVSYELDGSVERYVAGGDERTDGAKSYAVAASELESALASGSSTLTVCNTIDSARELTETVIGRLPGATEVAEVYADLLVEEGRADAVTATAVADRVEESSETAVLHLSTRLRPVDRLTLIAVAKELTARAYPVLAVTTQLVEAGVDISFDRVYRDLAPIDSVVQAGGRCNRSFERKQGTVTVWWLDAPEDQTKTPAEAVYNRRSSLLPVAARALDSVRGEAGELTETAVARDAVIDYYERLRDDRDVGDQSYVDHVDRANADELAELSLIDQQRAVDVFVTRTDADRERAEKIRDAKHGFDFERLQAQLDATKPLRISVPIYPGDGETEEALQHLEPLLPDEGLFELDARHGSPYFDRTTGFVVPESSVAHQFL